MKKESKSLLWGILAGSVVGSVTALLLAPKPGKELRKEIAEGTTGAIDKVQDVAGQAGDKGAELYGKAKEAVETVVTEVKEWSKQHIHAKLRKKSILPSAEFQLKSPRQYRTLRKLLLKRLPQAVMNPQWRSKTFWRME